VSRGLDDEGVTRSEARVVGSVLGEVSCTTQWDQVLAMARDPAVQMVVSNTTEAGIVYAPGMTPRDAPPPSFPAKVTRLLLERWRTLGHLRGTGWQFLPCELTTDSGDLLRSIVLRHATEWEVEAGFVEWIADENVFFNTLVDRIVTGHPGAAAAALEAELGYRDPCLTTAELYHLLVIETPAGRPKPKLRLADFDAGTIEVADAGPYRLRKVALLNGGHTALCPLALICGVETVGEAVRDPGVPRERGAGEALVGEPREAARRGVAVPGRADGGEDFDRGRKEERVLAAPLPLRGPRLRFRRRLCPGLQGLSGLDGGSLPAGRRFGALRQAHARGARRRCSFVEREARPRGAAVGGDACAGRHPPSGEKAQRRGRARGEAGRAVARGEQVTGRRRKA
jgi:hypothetical protein